MDPHGWSCLLFGRAKLGVKNLEPPPHDQTEPKAVIHATHRANHGAGGGDLQKAFTDSQGTNRPEPPKPIPHRLLLLSRPQGANELPEDLYP